MKTTLEIPDELFLKAKSIAARRRTTLKAMIEHALRREIQEPQELSEADAERFEVGPFGILRLKRRPSKPVATGTIQKLKDEAEEEEFHNALKLAGKL